MNKKIIIVCLFSLLIFSCDWFNPGDIDSSGNFWAQDFRFWPYRHYRVDAELLWEGLYCNVWVEKGSGTSLVQAQKVGNEYDNKIRQQMIDVFSSENITYSGRSFSDIMEVADWLGDKDDKLCILLLDIRDSYIKGINDSYIAGYFWSGDFFNLTNSNRRDMIYIDTNPGMENIEELFSTLAHEMQHMMNFVTSLTVRSGTMDTWIDEGLSSAAEWLYSGYSRSRIDWFINNGNKSGSMKGLIDKGNNFFVWGNYQNENDYYAILDDYSTVYLFFQWLRLQAGDDIYRKIISSANSDYRAVVNAVNVNSNYPNWETLLRTWLAANFINAASGQFGYMNDDVLKEIKVPVPSNIGLTVMLAPGEGVYSAANTTPNITGQGSNIKNAYLTNTVTTVYQSSSTMLTFNSNTNFRGNAESGATTGVTPPATAIIVPLGGRSIVSGDDKPYRIGAWDRLVVSNEE